MLLIGNLKKTRAFLTGRGRTLGTCSAQIDNCCYNKHYIFETLNIFGLLYNNFDFFSNQVFFMYYKKVFVVVNERIIYRDIGPQQRLT